MNTDLVNEVAKVFKPLDAAAYLRLHGWARTKMVPDKYALWTKSEEDQGEQEILLPLSVTPGDLLARIRDLLETLQATERRPLTEIVEDLSTPHFDIVRAQLAPGANIGGMIPLEQGAGIFERMRDLLLAAACATIAPRRVYGRRKPDQAMGYLRQAQLGQTARGSYVIRVLSPATPYFGSGQQSLLGDSTDRPYTQRVVETLAKSISAVSQAVQKVAVSGLPEAFDATVEDGVSANLCEAIAGLAAGAGGHDLQFSFSWAPTRPAVPMSEAHWRFSSDSIPYLGQASEHFRRTATIADVDVAGVVHKLEHAAADAGLVTIVGTADEERRTIVTHLTGEWHQLAITAYKERLMIACVGELEKKKGRWELQNVRNFHVVKDVD